jgi:hypothetical protein
MEILVGLATLVAMESDDGRYDQAQGLCML